MGDTPSCGRRVVATQLFHRSRKEVTRASRYQGTAHSATVELVPQGPGARLGHRRLCLLRDLPKDLLQVVAPVRRESVGPAESRGSVPAAPSPPPAGRDPAGPAALVPPAQRPAGGAERLRHPPGPAAGRAAHPPPQPAEAPNALRAAPPGRLRPGGHQGPSRPWWRGGRPSSTPRSMTARGSGWSASCRN